MDIIKIIGIGLMSLFIIIIIKQYKPEFAMYISLIAGVLILLLVLGRINGIIDLLKNLTNRSSINNEFIVILLKITGIAIITEYAVSICKDSGENAIANKVDFGGKIIVISMSIPIINGLLSSVLKILP